jgi:hypothetical protein
MLRGFRQWAKSLIYLDLLFTAAWYTAVAVIAIVGVVVAAVTGEYDHLPALLLTLASIGAVFWFAAWVSRDARRAARELRQQRRERGAGSEEPTRPKDMGNVAGVPQNPPWMG